MNRRSFTALLPALAASLPAFADDLNGEGQAGAPSAAETPVATGVFAGFTPPEQFAGRSGHSFLTRPSPCTIPPNDSNDRPPIP